MILHFYFSKNNETLPELNDKNLPQNILIECKKLYDKIFSKYFNKKFIDKKLLNEEYQEFDKEFIINIFKWSKAQISPICSIVGGYLSQEIIKVIGLYEPIKQWMFFDFYDAKISFEDNNIIKNNDLEIENSRYKEQLAIFGNEIQKKLEKLNINIIICFLIATFSGCKPLKPK